MCAPNSGVLRLRSRACRALLTRQVKLAREQSAEHAAGIREHVDARIDSLAARMEAQFALLFQRVESLAAVAPAGGVPPNPDVDVRGSDSASRPTAAASSVTSSPRDGDAAPSSAVLGAGAQRVLEIAQQRRSARELAKKRSRARLRMRAARAAGGGHGASATQD